MTSGSIVVLIDTNVSLYAVDPRDPFQQQRAFDVLERLDSRHSGAVSVQVLHECVSVTTRKLRSPLPADDARRAVRYVLRSWHVLALTQK